MKQLLHITILLSLLALTACEDKIDLDLPQRGPEQLVVDGWLTDIDTVHYVRLSKTSAYFSEDEVPPVSNATVVLENDQGNLDTLPEDPQQAGRYIIEGGGEVGRSYRLQIADGDNQYVSEWEEITAVPPILDIKWEENEPSDISDEDEEEGLIYSVLIDTYEDEGPNDFYRWRVFVNGEYQSEPEDIIIANDNGVDGSIVADYDVSDEYYALGDTVTIWQESISESMYDFWLKVLNQTAFTGSPFDTPPAPIESNLSNTDENGVKPLGIFGASSVSRATIVVGE